MLDLLVELGGLLTVVLVTVVVVRADPVQRGWPGLYELLVAVPLTALLCTRSLQLTRSGGAVHIALDSAVLVLLLSTVPPATALLTWLLGVACGELLSRQRRWAARAFNLGIAGLSGSVLVAAGHLADSRAGHVGPRDLVALVLGTLGYVAVDLVLTALSVAWAEQQPVVATLLDETAPVAVLAVLAVNAVGLLGSLLTVTSPWALALLVPVLAAPVHAARSSASAHLERVRTAALFDAATQAAGDRDELELAVTSAARAVTSAPAARLGGPPPSAGQLGAQVGAGADPPWLVADSRPAGNAFTARDAAALHVLAALTSEALERLEVLAVMNRAASSDALTGLANRRDMERALADAVSQADDKVDDQVDDQADPPSVGSGPRRPGLVYLDLDGFKAVNDTYGHAVGDELLVAVAKRLSAQVREQDLVARWGGDEFVVLLRDTDDDHALVTAERLCTAVSGDLALASAPGAVVRVTASAGVALHRAGSPPRDLLAAADAAMYAAKSRARAGGRVQQREPLPLAAERAGPAA